jgi:hypothetical protein
MGKQLNSDKLSRLYQIFSAKLVLEVFGGAGAIWGFSEAVGLREPTTVWFWRPCALTFGAIFFVRWLCQIRDHVAEEDVIVPKMFSCKLIRTFQIFSAKLVLEVFGGAGAIWGFSEAVGLRVPATIWFWRPCALSFGAIFLVRWLRQALDHIKEEDVRLSLAKETVIAGGDTGEGQHLLSLATMGK